MVRECADLGLAAPRINLGMGKLREGDGNKQ
jgi:hypothetical protein